LHRDIQLGGDSSYQITEEVRGFFCIATQRETQAEGFLAHHYLCGTYEILP
jgi:hypothetical protein